MTTTCLKPLILAASVALALTACGKQESAQTPPAPAGTASTAGASSRWRRVSSCNDRSAVTFVSGQTKLDGNVLSWCISSRVRS